MPIYEYECRSCGKTLEAIQKFSDAPLARCESCGGNLTKLVSRTSFQLKGTGWYATDYKKNTGGSAKSNGGAQAAESKKDASESKNESKNGAAPAASSEATKTKASDGGAKD